MVTTAVTPEMLRLKERIEAMTLKELQVRVIFLEGLYKGSTGKFAPASSV